MDIQKWNVSEGFLFDVFFKVNHSSLRILFKLTRHCEGYCLFVFLSLKDLTIKIQDNIRRYFCSLVFTACIFFFSLKIYITSRKERLLSFWGVASRKGPTPFCHSGQNLPRIQDTWVTFLLGPDECPETPPTYQARALSTLSRAVLGGSILYHFWWNSAIS